MREHSLKEYLSQVEQIRLSEKLNLNTYTMVPLLDLNQKSSKTLWQDQHMKCSKKEHLIQRINSNIEKMIREVNILVIEVRSYSQRDHILLLWDKEVHSMELSWHLEQTETFQRNKEILQDLPLMDHLKDQIFHIKDTIRLLDPIGNILRIL